MEVEECKESFRQPYEAPLGNSQHPPSPPSPQPQTRRQRRQELDALMTVIAELLEQAVDDDSTGFLVSRGGLSGKQAPMISIKSYLRRVEMEGGCTPANLVFSVVYIARITKNPKSIRLNRYNVHRLLLTSLLITEKYHED